MEIWRLHVQLSQLEACIKNQAHALTREPKFVPGDILLFQITKHTCPVDNERIPCYMKFAEVHEDPKRVIEIWGNAWKKYRYLIQGANLKLIKPFNLGEDGVKESTNPAIKLTGKRKTFVEQLLADSKKNPEESNLLPEGEVMYRLHRLLERKKSNTDAVKKRFLKNNEYLFCELCEFDFAKAYSTEYIECHHNIPLCEMKNPKKSNIEDFTLVCSNCHRIIHSKRPALKIQEIKSKIKVTYTY